MMEQLSIGAEKEHVSSVCPGSSCRYRVTISAVVMQLSFSAWSFRLWSFCRPPGQVQ